MTKNLKFLELLCTHQILPKDAVQQLHRKYQEDAFALLQHLIRNNAHDKTTLARIWADSIGIAYVDLRKTLFQREIVKLLSEKYARKNHIILLYQFGDSYTAACAHSENRFLLKEAAEICGKSISPVFALPQDIEDAIEIEYQTEDTLKNLSSKIVTDTIQIEDISELTKDQLEKIAGDQSVVEFAHGLLLLAAREGASDVHIEPGEEKVRVRLRIDGVLEEKSKLERSLLPPLVSRLKILANLDITERRKPQDGRINIKLNNRSIDFRFSSIPTIYGEKIVLRMLGQAQGCDVPDLTELNFSKSILDALQKVAQTPHGIFFVTGPTGSGKTTTLFSMLKYLNKPGINITTIEDPVEYSLPGTNQVQTNSAVELDFPTALRAYLRQDPDVILVGEIRDLETAEISCRAALTGHLVLATMHTNTAIQAITRLTDIGVQSFIVAPSMIGVLAQRLVRKICDYCREKYVPPASVVEKILDSESRNIAFYRGRGCVHCNNSGYSGRIAIHEIVIVDDKMRGLMAREATLQEVQEYARDKGFQTMRYDGIKKVFRGLTTIDEVDRVAMADELFM